MGLGRRLDVPGDEFRVQRLRDFLGENRLAGARLAFDEKGALKGYRSVNGNPKVLGRDVILGTFKLHGYRLSLRGAPASSPCSP
jgi:hypothetical protein